MHLVSASWYWKHWAQWAWEDDSSKRKHLLPLVVPSPPEGCPENVVTAVCGWCLMQGLPPSQELPPQAGQAPMLEKPLLAKVYLSVWVHFKKWIKAMSYRVFGTSVARFFFQKEDYVNAVFSNLDSKSTDNCGSSCEHLLLFQDWK